HFSYYVSLVPRHLHSFPTRRSSDLYSAPGSTSARNTWRTSRRSARANTAFRSAASDMSGSSAGDLVSVVIATYNMGRYLPEAVRSEEHTSELQSRGHLVCRLLLEKK